MSQRYYFKLKDQEGEAISGSGGVCMVAQASSTLKRAITDKDGVALTNPRALTTGSCEFYVANTVTSVDLYIMAPGGQFLVEAALVPGSYDFAVNTRERRQLAKIPFNIADTTAATETDTGFDLPEDSLVLDRLHGEGLNITALDATETMDVGTGEVTPAEAGGDANGFNAAADVGAATGYLMGTNGALFSSNAPYRTEANAARSITYTLTAGSDTAAGFILLPYVLCG